MNTIKDRISLKSLKLNEAMSDETFCFSAIICLDGKPVCRVLNRGHGGCDEYESLKGGNYYETVTPRINEINAELAKLPPLESKYSPQGLKWDLELLVAELIEDERLRKAFKRILKREVVAKEADGWHAWRLRQKGRTFSVEDVAKYLTEKRGVKRDEIINLMPEAKAFAVWKEVCAA